jgi:hypothetical protein
MIMVRRDINVEGYENGDYFMAVIPSSVPSTYLGLIMAEKFQPLKEKFVAAFIEPPYSFVIEAFFEVVFEDGKKQFWPFALMQKKSRIAPDDSFWKGINIPDEYCPQNRQKEEETLVQIINDLNAKGYHVREEHFRQFLDRKTDKLLLESN